MARCILYSVPFIPIVTRTLLILIFYRKMKTILSGDQLDRETHRTHIYALAGFSFTALIAIIVLDVTINQNFHFSIYYLMMSFLGYLIALNLQSYKNRRWIDQLATAFIDFATLNLILSVLSILNTKKFGSVFPLIMSILAIVTWLTDHILRLRFDWVYLKSLKEIQK